MTTMPGLGFFLFPPKTVGIVVIVFLYFLVGGAMRTMDGYIHLTVHLQTRNLPNNSLYIVTIHIILKFTGPKPTSHRKYRA